MKNGLDNLYSHTCQMALFSYNFYIVHVSDGKNFNASKYKNIWCFKSTTACWINFMRNVNPGDILCFIKNGGFVVGFAQYIEHKRRELGPLISLTMTNEELGWTKDGDWDMELHYKGYIDSATNLKLKTPNQNSVIHWKNFQNQSDIFMNYIQSLQNHVLTH